MVAAYFKMIALNATGNDMLLMMVLSTMSTLTGEIYVPSRFRIALYFYYNLIDTTYVLSYSSSL